MKYIFCFLFLMVSVLGFSQNLGDWFGTPNITQSFCKHQFKYNENTRLCEICGFKQEFKNLLSENVKNDTNLVLVTIISNIPDGQIYLDGTQVQSLPTSDPNVYLCYFVKGKHTVSVVNGDKKSTYKGILEKESIITLFE